MVQLNLPKNSKITEGRSWAYPTGARDVREYRIYRWNPDDGKNPADRHLLCRLRRLRADGSRRADLDQEQYRPDTDLPPLLPRGRVRLLRHEHRRRQHARLHQARRRHQGHGEDLSAAAPAGGEGPGARTSPISMRNTPRSSRGCTPSRRRRRRNGGRATRTARSSTGSTNASCAPAARPRARATGGIPSASSAPPRSCRRAAGSTTAATRRMASGSTISRTRSGSTVATPS